LRCCRRKNDLVKGVQKDVKKNYIDFKHTIVMNSTCIHLRAECPNIFKYRGGEYTKNPLKKYNNRKD
jgi:hypothetical protein